MKYIKTYEGLFSKEPKVPQAFIDKVIKTIKDGGYPNTKVVASSPVVNSSDRTTIIRSQTPIGNMLTIIQLIFDKDESRIKPLNKLVKGVIGGVEKYYSISMSVFPEDKEMKYSKYNRRSLMIGKSSWYSPKGWLPIGHYVNSVKLKDIDGIKFNLIPTAIDQLVDQVQKETVRKKDLSDFYADFTQEELVDLISDLSDILDSSPVVTKSSSYGKGYRVTFKTSFNSTTINDKEIRFRASDMIAQTVAELNSLDKRLRDGYGLEMEFSILGRSVTIEVWKEEKKSEDDGSEDVRDLSTTIRV